MMRAQAQARALRRAEIRARSRTAARGFILPAVLLTMLVVALLATSLQAAVWQATRHARLGFAGERALLGADAAISQQLSAWDARRFASMNIGARNTTTVALNTGLTALVTLTRTGADAAFIEAGATSSLNGAPLNAHRLVARALVMHAPPLPLTSPLTSLGAITIANANSVSSVDEVPAGWTTECLGLTTINAPTGSSINVAAASALFDANWSRWAALASHSDDGGTVTQVAPFVSGAKCAAGAGEPWRGSGSVAPCTNEWGARIIRNSAPATLSGASRHQGVLLVDGDLVVTGTLDINGLLVVRGAVDASAGTLTVLGAALVRDESGHGSRFGIASRVRYSRCALRRALSAVGAPAAITSRGWLERF